MNKLLLLSASASLAVLATVSFAQGPSLPRSLESQLLCKADPKAGKLLMDMKQSGFIDRTYVVEDTISYFKLHKPMRVLGFNPVAVFGFQEGYEKFFERGPGTLPPEMIGIIVRGDQDSVKLRLRKMAIDNLEVEPHEYDLNTGNVRPKANLVSIACWAQ